MASKQVDYSVEVVATGDAAEKALDRVILVLEHLSENCESFYSCVTAKQAGGTSAAVYTLAHSRNTPHITESE